jgi:ACS family glucarate transporter-like MFS transporter
LQPGSFAAMLIGKVEPGGDRLEDLDFSSTALDESPARPTWVRYQVLAAGCGLAVITYIHRVGFATASAEFKKPLGLSDEHLGYMMAAFMIGYGLFEVPWGFLGDRFGVRNILAAIILGGSTLTACLALVAFLPRNVLVIVSFVVLLRFLFGAFQAGTFPSISRMTADWMPSTERGSAQGTIWMSSRLGGALAPLLLVRLFAAMGDWKMPLVLVAVLGLAWCAWFWPWFRNLPEEMSQVNREERKLIEAGRAQRAGARHGDVPWTRMLKSRSVWALCLMYGFLGFSGNFYLTLLPTYLRNHRHLSSEVTGWLTSLPFAFGVVACFVGGSFSDGIIRRWGKRWGRRIVGATGLTVAGLAILAVPWVENVVALGFLLTLAFFGNDLAMAPAWAAAADIGEHHTGTVAGTMNMMASFMAAVQAIVIGRLLGSHNLVMPFVLLAVSYALGTLAWIGVDARQTLAEQR